MTYARLSKQLSSSVSTSFLSWLANTFKINTSSQNDRNTLKNKVKNVNKTCMYSNLKIYQKFLRLKMATKNTKNITKKIEEKMLRSNFKCLYGLNQTFRLDYVKFQYYFFKSFCSILNSFLVHSECQL